MWFQSLFVKRFDQIAFFWWALQHRWNSGESFPLQGYVHYYILLREGVLLWFYLWRKLLCHKTPFCFVHPFFLSYIFALLFSLLPTT